MKLAISNIAWGKENDEAVYMLMQEFGFTGLEIAPTRIIEKVPYDMLHEAKRWKSEIVSKYGFEIPSMQSIWYGRQENIFASEDDRKSLIEYTQKAILFAEAINCKNLVFGCPRNRNMVETMRKDETANYYKIGVDFFKTIAKFANDHNTVIGMEANPTIYNTNYINTTEQALELVKEVDSPAFKLNLDLGTMIENNETVSVLENDIDIISHVHISEPRLALIQQRKIQKDILELLQTNNYQGFVSIEMGNTNLDSIEGAMKMVRGF